MLGCIVCLLLTVSSAFAQDNKLRWQGKAVPGREIVQFTEELTDEWAERGGDFQYRMSEILDQSVGIQSTKGRSDFHIFFDPKYGYRILSPEQGQVQQRAVLFPGADYSDVFPISIDLESPASVISFDRRPNLQVAFKIIEVKGVEGFLGDAQYLRLLVTSQGQVLPLSLEKVSLQFLANLEVNPGDENIAYLSNAFEKLVFFESGDLAQNHEQLVTLAGPANVKFRVGRMGVELVSSRDFNPKDPWKSLEEKTKLKKANVIQRFPNTSSDLSRFSLGLKTAPEVLVSNEFMFLDVIEVFQKDGDQSSRPWRKSLDALKVATLLDINQAVLPALKFYWNLETSSMLMASLPKLEHAYLLDLDNIPKNKDGSILDDLDQLKLLDARGYYLTVISNGLARIYYQPTHVDFSMEQLLSTESKLNCNIILAGRARMAQIHPDGAN